jgi:hypothetical protein
MSEYLVMVYVDESDTSSRPAPGDTMIKEHVLFQEKHGSALRGGNALQSTATATSIRPDPTGGFTVTDGAFAETKEALGGYYLIEAADLDEALAIAKEVPTSPGGGVEVRPIHTFA